MTADIRARLEEIKANDYRRDRNGAAAFRQSDLAAVDVPMLVAAIEGVLTAVDAMQDRANKTVVGDVFEAGASAGLITAAAGVREAISTALVRPEVKA